MSSPTSTTTSSRDTPSTTISDTTSLNAIITYLHSELSPRRDAIEDLTLTHQDEVSELKTHHEIEVNGLKDTISDMTRSRAPFEEVVTDSHFRRMSEMSADQLPLYERVNRQKEELEARGLTIAQQQCELEIRDESIGAMKVAHAAELKCVIAKGGEIYVEDQRKIEELQEELSAREERIERMKAKHARHVASTYEVGGDMSEEEYKEMEALEDEFTASQKENTRLRKKLGVRDEQLAGLQKLHENVVAKLKDERAEDATVSYHCTRSLKTQVAKLTEDLEMKDVAFNSLRQRHTVAKEALACALADVENVKAEKGQLQGALGALSLAFGDMALENENLWADVEQKHAEFMDQREEFEEGRLASAHENERLEEIVQQSDEAARDQREIVSALVAENEELQRQLAESKEAYQRLEQLAEEELSREVSEKFDVVLARAMSKKRRCDAEQERKEQVRALEEKLEGMEQELERLREETGSGPVCEVEWEAGNEDEQAEVEEDCVDVVSEHSIDGSSPSQRDENAASISGDLEDESAWEKAPTWSDDDGWNERNVEWEVESEGWSDGGGVWDDTNR